MGDHDEPTTPRDTIPLEGFLKREGVFETGGQAKVAIQGGDVRVNGVVETRRKKKLRVGDVVELPGARLVVETLEENDDDTIGDG
mgnify:CR=1 FL=1